MLHAVPSTRRGKALGAVALLVLIYVSSYFYLSLNGRFEPAAIGLNGVKSYNWGPKFFVFGYKWNRSIECVYLPLYALDVWFWHRRDDAYSGRYPVHEPEHIGDVYRAWED